MKSSYRRNKKRSGSAALVLTIALVFFVFALDAITQGGVRSLVRASGSQVWGAGSQIVAAVSGSGVLSTRRMLVEENEMLKQEIAQLKMHVAELAVLEAENTSLRSLVRVAEHDDGIVAPITSSLRASPYGTFTIGAGRADDVALGDAVVASTGSGSGYVVGYVEELAEHHALVKRIFAPDIETEALVRGTPFLAEGRGGGNARADVPRALDVAEGDVVASPHFAGYAIGIVGGIERDPANAEQTLFIGLPVNLSILRYVYVVSIGS